MRSETLTQAMHKGGVMILCAVIAVVCALTSYFTSSADIPMSAHGFVDKWSGEWYPVPFWSGPVAEALLIVVILLVTANINKTFNLLRAMSKLPSSYFLIMCAASPALLFKLCPGTLLCAVVVLCVAILYYVSAHEKPDMRSVFLVFAILSGCASFDVSYLIYIPVMLLGCMQLRMFSLRVLSASAMGVATPWIIFMGFGIVGPDDLQVPMPEFNLPSFSDPHTMQLLCTLVISVCVTVVALAQNLVKFLSYNARLRSLLGVITLTTFVTILAAVADYDQMYSFLTLLNLCAAFQLSHMFRAIHNFPKSYIAIVSVMTVYVGLSIWQMLL